MKTARHISYLQSFPASALVPVRQTKRKKQSAPWIHTGLNIPANLSRFIKKWGFTREEAERELGKYFSFCAIKNGVAFSLLVFPDIEMIALRGITKKERWISADYSVIYRLGIFMRDNS